MGPRAGQDRCGKSHPSGIRSPDRPARSQSLYRLSYWASQYDTRIFKTVPSERKGDVTDPNKTNCRSQWLRDLRRRSAAARLLRSWVRIPPRAWMFVCCECCVLSGRGLCHELITRPEESYRLWCVVVCDLETSRMRKP